MPSLLADASVLPSGANATPLTTRPWPLRMARGLPVAASQRAMAWRMEQARVLPSGDHARAHGRPLRQTAERDAPPSHVPQVRPPVAADCQGPPVRGKSQRPGSAGRRPQGFCSAPGRRQQFHRVAGKGAADNGQRAAIRRETQGLMGAAGPKDRPQLSRRWIPERNPAMQARGTPASRRQRERSPGR